MTLFAKKGSWSSRFTEFRPIRWHVWLKTGPSGLKIVQSHRYFFLCNLLLTLNLSRSQIFFCPLFVFNRFYIIWAVNQTAYPVSTAGFFSAAFRDEKLRYWTVARRATGRGVRLGGSCAFLHAPQHNAKDDTGNADRPGDDEEDAVSSHQRVAMLR